jgi:CelD/BcsL family acetyltransferase involved in cellulose biosynthesis
MVVFITRHRRPMARSLDQIHKDLKKLAADTAALDKKLRGLYGQYFPVLGAAVRQQLVLAAYHLCTQAYPEAFLALSKAEREKLQESLRKLGRQGQTHIEELVNLDNVSATLSLLLNSKEKRLRAAMVSGDKIGDYRYPRGASCCWGHSSRGPGCPN